MATITPYNFKNVNVSYFGIPITGFAQGDDAITVVPNADLTNSIVGADGGATLNMTNDRSAVATLKLLSTSESNNVLGGFYELVAAGVTVGSVGPLAILDSAGNAKFVGLSAVANFPADTQFGNNETGRTWKFIIPEMVTYPGSVGTPVQG